MTTKCVYCRTEINDNRSMEICDRCGVKVWGPKMFEAIKKTTDDARDNDDLCRTNMNPEQAEGWEKNKSVSRNALR
jgi:hypothetical protein